MKQLLRNVSALIGLLLVSVLGIVDAKAETITPPTGNDVCLLSSLDLTTVTYFNDDNKNKVYADKATFGTPLIIAGNTYTTGVGTHAPSKFVVKVNGAKSFHAIFGIDAAAPTQAKHGIVDYTVTTYNSSKQATTVKSGTITVNDATGTTIDVDLIGAVYLILNFDKGEEAWGDHVDLGDAYFKYAGTAPQLINESDMWQEGSNVVTIPDAPLGQEYIRLSSLEIEKTKCGWENHTPKKDKSIDGNKITIGGKVYESGVGTHGPSQIIIKLNGSVTDFYTVLGVDDEVKEAGNFDYHVYVKAEGGATEDVAKGTINRFSNQSVEIHADNLSGWKYLYLETSNGTDGTNTCDHVDWANAYLVFQDQNSTRPCIVSAEELTTKLACATTVFSQPNVRFMQKVRSTVTGAQLSVSNLPAGLTWNAARNIVEGVVAEEGVYTYQINVTVDGETTSEDVTLTVSSSLQHPVPFMGWLSWNSVQGNISQKIIEQAVELFQNKGLYECGWNHIMMDDLWQGTRKADGTPQPNASRFPNGLKTVADFVHKNGMKFGLYTDAADRTCAGAFGSYGYETIDANTYAEWGVDVVKCDYCYAPDDVETAKKRYKALADAFAAAGNNTMLYICEWGVREPWKWGAEVGGRCWRISQDVRDCWTGSGSGVGVVQSIEAMKNLSAYQGVNRFNDSDMLCTGLHATGKSSNDLCGGTGAGMTDDEYATQFALWCMWSSPMALSFDPSKNTLTDADFKLLRNKELIALNQDRMGQQGDLISEADNLVVFAKDCENGDVALSVTNMSSSEKQATFDFTAIPALDPTKTYTVRDVMENAEAGEATGTFTTDVRKHATRVFRLAEKKVVDGVASTVAAKDFSIVAGKNCVKINMPETAGLAKRILVSDFEGRVVGGLTTTADKAKVALAKGTYLVTVVCNAQATTVKVQI
ncbi:NPCBM/NEW2 domain-containing protein [Leyella stercorea]|uniref:NPCBM/NEW2 domain-containing protein n=1 Tax=Leyella stercorea TaxID=363265 RepID=UPI00242EAC21|nr:NPCBM/NEW2 domain-containing protein [Leyella stercorea]